MRHAAIALVPVLALAACDRGGTATTTDPAEASVVPEGGATDSTRYQDGVYYDGATGAAAATAGASGQTGTAVTPPVTATDGEGVTTPMDAPQTTPGTPPPS